MRILLPPSEAKHRGGRGRPIGRLGAQDTTGAGDPLRVARGRALDALETLCAGPDAVAAQALLLPPAVAAEALADNRRVRTAGTTSALRRYAGVVYDGLDQAALPPAARSLAGRSVLIFSGLFGVVRGNDAVPAYRVPAKAVLPGLGVAGTFWRPTLDEVLPGMLGRGLVIDLRSSDYAAMWRPRGTIATHVITVRVLSPLPGGGRGVVSHPSKLAKGRLAAALLVRAAAGRPVRGADDLARAWSAHGRADVIAPDRVEIHTD